LRRVIGLEEETKSALSRGAFPPNLLDNEFSNKLFDYLVKSFIEDYMRKKYVVEKSGWRGLVEAARAIGRSPRTMYGRTEGFSPQVGALIRRGLVETRTTPGQRGRGGVASKLRIAYERRPVQVLVERTVWGKERNLLSQLESTRVAVLPFHNISPNPKDEYLADGLTEELIDVLSKVRELSVVSRTSTLQYLRREKSVQEIGRELNVGTVLEGSVRRSGDQIRVNIQMIDALEDRHIWADQYDRALEDLFKIQSDIALRVAAALRVHLLSNERKEIRRSPTASAQAYQSYLKGRHYFNFYSARKDLSKAFMYFREATALDPNCAVAYAGVSGYYHVGAHHGWFTPEEAFPKMKKFASRALEIDPDLAEAHGALGAVYFHYDWKWKQAEMEFARAVELRPNYGAGFDMYQHLMAIMGEFGRAQELIRQGAELSPFYGKGWAIPRAETMFFTGKVKESILTIEQAVTSSPENASFHRHLGFAYYRTSKVEEGVAEVRRAAEMDKRDMRLRADLGLILALSGHKGEAGRILASLVEEAKSNYVSLVQLGCIRYALGKEDEAFDSLRGALARKDIDLPEVRMTPGLGRLHSDPRWLEIEAAMGLPPIAGGN
jgi:adenylate cyclase